MITTWILVIFFHVGSMGSGNSNTCDHIVGFKSAQECQTAGKSLKPLVNGTTKEVNFVCIQQTSQ